MKFLLDQDVYAVTGRLLAGLGHDIVTASSIGLSAADDSNLLARAHDEGRVFVTRCPAIAFTEGSTHRASR
jgi:predicted nuclease of predicted toxin-antitoxin system